MKPACAGFLFWNTMPKKTGELVSFEDWRWRLLICVAILLVSAGFWKHQWNMAEATIAPLMRPQAWLEMDLGWEPDGQLGRGIYSHAGKDARLVHKVVGDGLKQECPVPVEPRLAVFTFKAMDLNQIDLDTLRVLKGVGPKTAAAIISYRQNRGPFRKIEDLLEVKGVGPARLKVLRRSLAVNVSVDS